VKPLWVFDVLDCHIAFVIGVSIIGLKVESNPIITYLDSINEAYCSCIFSMKEGRTLGSMVFDVIGQAR
jgi:hypothetical protein